MKWFCTATRGKQDIHKFANKNECTTFAKKLAKETGIPHFVLTVDKDGKAKHIHKFE